MENNQNILLFVGNDYVVNIFLNRTISHIINMGLNPILIRVNNTCSKHYDFAEMKRYKFYENDILNNYIYPYIEEQIDKQFASKSIQQIIHENDLQVIDVNNVNDNDFIKTIKSIDFIGAISLRCFQIFKENTIKAIKEKGFFYNSHPGILPDYRGVYCLLRGLVNGETKLGWTLHEIDAGIDTGNVIKEIPYYDFSSTQSMISILAQTAITLSHGWVEVLSAITKKCEIDPYKQKSKGQYFTYPTANEMSRWIDNGKLKQISAKEMVQFYFNLFIAPQDRIKPFALDFKTFLINKVSQFETLLEMEASKDTSGAPQKQAA